MNKTWFTNDTFWQKTYLYMFNTNRSALTPTEVDGIIALTGAKAGDAILDIACGNGRHLLELARRGFISLHGIDHSHFLLSIAKKQSEQEGLNVEFSKADMLAYRQPEQYNAVLNMFSSLGYFDKPADNLRVLKNAHISLKPGGKLLVDVRGKENFAYNFDRQSWGEQNDGLILTNRTALDNFSRIKNRWIIIKDGQQQEYEFTHWIYSAHELQSMFIAAGFKKVKVYGGFDGRAYAPESNRLIAVATK